MFGNNPTLRFPGNLMQVRSITELRGISPYEMNDEAAILVTAAGLFTFDPSSMANDDGVSVVRPDGFTPLQSGRWVLPGSADKDNTFTTLTSLQAASPTLKVATLVGDPTEADGTFFYRNGAWVRQGANSFAFQQTGSATIRNIETKLREVEKSVTDYGTGTDWGVLVDAAVASLGMTSAVRLVTPPGVWTTSGRDYSAYRNITFVIHAGGQIDNGSSAIVLPERVEVGLGAGFTGAGLVTQKNKDESPLAEPGGGHVRAGNVASGVGALAKNAGGYSNFAMGNNALALSQYGRGNIALGNAVLSKIVGDQTGARATISSGEIISYNARGDANLGIGNTALRDCTTGVENLALGDATMQQLTTGLCNIAVGANSQITNLTGNFNVSLGAYALVVNQGSNNIAIGWAALEGQTSGSNIAIGHAVMNGNKTGTSNVVIGPLGMQAAQAPTDSVVVGQEAAKNLAGAMGVTAVGAFAVGSSSATLVNTTAIGRNALLVIATDECTGVGAAALSANTEFGNCAGFGVNAQVTGPNQVQLGDARTTTYAYGSVQNRSDIRDKADIRDTVLGLDFIMALRPVDFRWNMRDYYRDEAGNMPTTVPDQSKKRTRYHHGLIAQEVRDVIEGSGTDFGGFQDHKILGGEDVLSLGYEELIAPLIKAVQQLTARVAELES